MSEPPRLTLKCPHCGAPLPPESLEQTVTCAFCGVVSAPSQVAAGPTSPPTSVSTKAAVAVATEQLQSKNTYCPRCGLPMYEGRANDIAMLGCGRCGGIWLTNDSAQRVVQTFDQAVVALADQAAQRAAFNVDPGPPVACPVCQKILVRTKSRESGIWIDVCGEHGTWFDRYELGVIFNSLAPKEPTQPQVYNGETPDFRRGANTELPDFVKVLERELWEW
ncbi:MAG: zf-TFIIB domain-containing protein [Polyangiaceae bacterium]|nr:zf-TFIIB domain-containing protein [Polyangiaceae bacterium]